MKTVEDMDLQVFEKEFLHRLFYFIFDSHVNNRYLIATKVLPNTRLYYIDSYKCSNCSKCNISGMK